MRESHVTRLTRRLELSPLSHRDVDDLFRIYGDPATWVHLPEGRYIRREQAVRQVERAQDGHREQGLGMWALRVARGAGTADLPAGTFIGSGGAQFLAEGGVLNLGYRLSPVAWGRGFATEVATAALQAAAEVVPEIPVTARVLTNNPASVTVLEKVGLGLIWEGMGGLGGEAPAAAEANVPGEGRTPLRRIYSDRALTPSAFSWLIANA
ncbi:GNAT family N-acetyltransferase [Mycetocola saprophilus]|uniref:GNAT family N-acetyltransferase n=1 Tax=Mycetocola saprophilus TaxID=76636 RepID=UPI0009DE1E74|nr:GNAT family N-acetyltransferase [Mycetocola saprophilus]